MLKAKHIFLVYTLLFSGILFGFTTTPKKRTTVGKGIRLSLGPAAGFYMINRNHAKAVLAGPSAFFSYKREKRFGNDFRTFFLYGFDYFFQTFNFQSYYFTQDTLRLYDKSMKYKYSVFLQEINIPFNVKYSFNRENNSQFTNYFMIGYHLRYILPAELKVSENGNEILTDNPRMKFKNYLISEQVNAFVSAAFGWQRNNTASAKAGFFIEVNYRYGFSPYYFDPKYAANALFISSSHISLQLGIKF